MGLPNTMEYMIIEDSNDFKTNVELLKCHLIDTWKLNGNSMIMAVHGQGYPGAMRVQAILYSHYTQRYAASTTYPNTVHPPSLHLPDVICTSPTT